MPLPPGTVDARLPPPPAPAGTDEPNDLGASSSYGTFCAGMKTASPVVLSATEA